MNDILTVFGFTLRDNIRKKAFIITTVIVLAVMVAGCAILGATSGKTSTGDLDGNVSAEVFVPHSTCYVIDDFGLIPGFNEALSQAYPTIDFRLGNASALSAYKTDIEQDADLSAIEVEQGTSGLPVLHFYQKDYNSSVPAEGVSEIARMVYASGILTGAGVSADVAQAAMVKIPFTTTSLSEMDLSGYILGILITILVFFSVYFYGYGVAMSVASEKTSRVMETLIVSAKPSRILLGKCLAMGTLGLLQMTLYLVVGGISFSLFVPDDFTIGGTKLILSVFTVPSALLVLVYFLLGYSLYAMMNSVCGATVSRAEDLHSAMMPTMLISLVSFYAAYIVMFLPNEGVKRIITFIPFTSPFIMPFRLLNETVPVSDILISIAILFVSTIVISIGSIHLYTASVLHYGQRLKIKELLKLKV